MGKFDKPVRRSPGALLPFLLAAAGSGVPLMPYGSREGNARVACISKKSVDAKVKKQRRATKKSRRKNRR